MNLNEAGESSGGVFNIIGAAPDLGIDTPTQLLSASVIGAACDNDTQTVYDPRCYLHIQMQIQYFDQRFGDWGPYLSLRGGLWGLSYSFPSAPDNREDLFSQSWFGGLSDYLDLNSVASVAVPEPSTLSLFGFGLFGLAFSMRHRLAERLLITSG